MGTLKQHWQKVVAGMKSSMNPREGPSPDPEEMRRDILSLGRENQTLIGRLERLHADFERTSSEEMYKIAALEQLNQEMDTARKADAERQLELEHQCARIESAHELMHEQIRAIETSLAETSGRLEKRDNQLRFLQNSTSDQLKVLETSLAEASSRLETRDNQLGDQQEAMRAQILAIEASLAEMAKRLQASDDRFRDLQVMMTEQAKQLDTRFSSTVSRLEATNNQLGALERKLELEHELTWSMVRETQMQLHQYRRLWNRIMAALAIAFVVLAVAGVLLLRDV